MRNFFLSISQKFFVAAITCGFKGGTYFLLALLLNPWFKTRIGSGRGPAEGTVMAMGILWI
jgi:hypothetical protein